MKIVLLLVAFVALETTAVAQPSAEDLYAKGQEAYDRADYKAAVAQWQASYDLSKESGLLFNLAQAKRLSGDCGGAIETYRRFVADDPDSTSEQHKLAKDLALELEGKCPERKPVTVTPPKAIETAIAPPRVIDPPRANSNRDDRGEQDGRTWKIAGIVTGGVGIVTLAVGLGLGHHGATIGNEVTAACHVSCDWTTLKDKDARGRRAVAIGRALNITGGAVIAGGAVLYYLGIRQETITVAPAPSGSGGVVSWGGTW